MDKSKLLRALARKNGLCDKWFSEWSDEENDQRLIDKYIKGQDFCIEHNYPPLPMIRSVFSPEILHKNHIYTDGEAYERNPKRYVIALGDSLLNLRFDGFSVATVYARHSSTVSISVYERAIIDVRLFDNAKVEIKHLDARAKLNIFVRSCDAELDLDVYANSDNLKIHPFKNDQGTRSGKVHPRKIEIGRGVF